MNIQPGTPLLPEALSTARAFITMLPELGSGFIHRIYLHWTVAAFGCTFDDYNGEADFENGAWVMKLTHSPVDNANADQAKEAAHTFHRNSHALGVSVAGMDKANFRDFGPHTVNEHGIEHMLALAASFCVKYGVDANAEAPNVFGVQVDPQWGTGEHTVMTHAEAALMTPSGRFAHYFCYKDGSDPDCRWDHATQNPQLTAPDEAEARATGDIYRRRIHDYASALKTASVTAAGLTPALSKV
jgi:hypothetical protein